MGFRPNAIDHLTLPHIGGERNGSLTEAHRMDAGGGHDRRERDERHSPTGRRGCTVRSTDSRGVAAGYVAMHAACACESCCFRGGRGARVVRSFVSRPPS
eukprot:7350295-Prymnesium_polylepis.1